MRVFLLLFAARLTLAQTAALSEPAATRWKQFGTPYFSTNEKLLNLFYPSFDNLGGVTVGVSFQQNLSLLVHARPELAVIFDINPGLTEILVPFFGKLWERCATRREFLSTLIGAVITPEETTRLLESPTESIPATLGGIFERVDEAARQQRIEGLRQILRDDILPRLPPEATRAMRERALTWIGLLEEQEILPGTFFHDATAAYTLSNEPSGQARLGGWLSTEDNYRTVREYWMAGRIVCITGDISGPSVAKLGDWIRANRSLQNPRVTAIYLSNVGASVEGHFPMTWFRGLYAALAQLPLAPNAMTLIAQGPWRLTAFAQTFEEAQWAHEMLSGVPESAAIQVHEAPLEAGVQLGRPAVLASLRQRVPPPYRGLIERIEENPAAIRFLDGAGFTKWSAPLAATDSPVFRAILVTLTESGYLIGRGRGTMDIELDAFSGRPNPAWRVAGPEADEIEQKLNSLRERADRPPHVPDLGFRGFLITFGGHTTRIFQGHAMRAETWYRDTAGIEAILKNQAKQRGFQSIVEN